VEDHPTMRLGVSSLLGVAGDIEVVGESESAGEALHLAEELRPDLVVLDLRLKGEEGGIEACREIKSLPDPPRVLVHTAYNTEEDVAATLLSGADGFLHKGEDYTKLPEAVRKTHAGERVWMLGGDVEQAEDEVLRSSEEVLLTPREKEVLALVLKRYTNAEISERLSISLQTTKNHVSSILRKLGKHSRRELFRGRFGR